LDLSITQDDSRFLFRQKKVSEENLTKLLKFSTVQVPGNLLACLKYAKARPDKLVERYQESYSRLTGTTLDVEKEVPKPEPALDLIGMEKIMEEIHTSIINPIQLNHPNVLIKKGIVLYGPPGGGKTSLGRWLAHRLKGKLYLIGGEAGVSGSAFISTIENNLVQAYQNAPAVVFVDDVDRIFENADSYRALLTLLDGLDNKKRNNVCVMVTCMDIRKIPASLIRGGRLEMCINVPLPTPDTIRKILEGGLVKVLTTLRDLLPDKVDELTSQLTDNFYSNLTRKMVGWNCADVNRCVHDVLRRLLDKKGSNLEELFTTCIKSISDQYELCQKSENIELPDHVKPMFS